jgi:hypothetical protein
MLGFLNSSAMGPKPAKKITRCPAFERPAADVIAT